MKYFLFTILLGTTAAEARGIGDIRSGEMGYRLGCSIHELAETGFHCPEYQEHHELLYQPPYWPLDHGFENPFVPELLNEKIPGGEFCPGGPCPPTMRNRPI